MRTYVFDGHVEQTFIHFGGYGNRRKTIGLRILKSVFQISTILNCCF